MNLSVNNIPTIERFASKIGKCTRQLNQVALRELKSDRVRYTFPKATPEDLIRLTSPKIEDTYKRVTWTNPKDKKVYHILEENRSEKGIDVRILSSEGEFVKNATLQPKTVVIFDQFKNLGGLRNLLKFKLPNYPGHGEIAETYLRRANPFINIERLEHKQNLLEQIKYRGGLPLDLMTKRFEELNTKMINGHKVDYISISEGNMMDIIEYSKSPGEYQKQIVKDLGLGEEHNDLVQAFKSIKDNGSRIFVSSGNDTPSSINRLLAIDGVEGVGAFAHNGKVAPFSASRNSIFTQHYELGRFRGRVIEENGEKLGINITGLPGVDLPYNDKYKHLLRNIQGTSYSTPVRVGKISLNDMMEGIL